MYHDWTLDRLAGTSKGQTDVSERMEFHAGLSNEIWKYWLTVEEQRRELYKNADTNLLS